MLEGTELERDVVQLAVREAVSLAMETPLGDPIQDAVEATSAASSARLAEPTGTTESVAEDAETETAPTDSGSDTDVADGRSVGRTLAGLAVVGLAIYLALRWFSADEE